MSKKIAIVLTGGTIGSETGAQTIDLPQTGHIPLITRYRELYPGDLDTYDIFTPIQILSENITGDKLHALLQFLIRLNKQEYSGILITHGSDTVHFTAAMAALLFATAQLPIIFTCALKAPDHPQTDAFRNLHLAVEAIRQQIAGVWFGFQNPEGAPFLLDAARMAPCTQSGTFHDSFAAPAYEYKNGRYVQNPAYRPMHYHCGPYTMPTTFQKVLFIQPYPLLDYHAITLDACDCVLHCGYHSATACCEGEDTSILRFIERCSRQNIPFYFLLPEPLEKPYGTTARILASAAIPLHGFTPYAAYAHLLLQNTKKPLLP